jgi:hypothetical protein
MDREDVEVANNFHGNFQPDRITVLYKNLNISSTN